MGPEKPKKTKKTKKPKKPKIYKLWTQESIVCKSLVFLFFLVFWGGSFWVVLFMKFVLDIHRNPEKPKKPKKTKKTKKPKIYKLWAQESIVCKSLVFLVF